MYSCGSTWMTWRSLGSGIALDCSRTRSTSVSRTSRSAIAATPSLLRPLTWLPAIPAYTLRISHPAMVSACSMAARIALTVSSMLTTTPRFRPLEGTEPMPMISTPSSTSSPTMAQTLVVPRSSPAISSLSAISVAPLRSGASREILVLQTGPKKLANLCAFRAYRGRTVTRPGRRALSRYT